jgi:hypothetical protein
MGEREEAQKAQKGRSKAHGESECYDGPSLSTDSVAPFREALENAP